MKDLLGLLEFLLAPARRVPWRVATLFGVFLGLTLVVGDVIPVTQPLRTALGVATCLAAGYVGASRGREFDQGILAVFTAIVIANLVAAAVIVVSSPTALNSASALFDALDLPLPGMLLLGVPVGTIGAGVAAWRSHRASAAA